MKRAAAVGVGLLLVVMAGIISEKGRRLDAEILEVVGEMQQNIAHLQSETDSLIATYRGIPGIISAGGKLSADLAEAGLLLEDGSQAVKTTRWLPQVSRQRAIGNIRDSLEIQKRVIARLQELAHYLGEKISVPDPGQTIAI